VLVTWLWLESVVGLSLKVESSVDSELVVAAAVAAAQLECPVDSAVVASVVAVEALPRDWDPTWLD